ncbi:MAG: ABC transporter permease subunit [Myxococcota bacterium]
MRRPLVSALAMSLALFPLAFLLLTAVAGSWPAPRLVPEELSGTRFFTVFSGGDGLLSSLLLSTGIGLVVAALSTSLGFITSRAIAESARRRFWTALAYLPFAVSPVILAVCLLFFFLRLGLAGTIFGVTLSHLPLAYGFAVVLLIGVWNPEKRGLADVARTLGASPFRVWWSVLVPAALPLLRVCFFQTFLISWVQYGMTLMIGQGAVKTLPLRVFDYVFESDPGLAAVAGLMLVAPPILMLWFERQMLLKAV